uniref:Uncharacterized protein n=1 Tax=Arundo donax TaxID=35708 RepID=A0A0A9C616_ARUDO
MFGHGARKSIMQCVVASNFPAAAVQLEKICIDIY